MKQEGAPASVIREAEEMMDKGQSISGGLIHDVPYVSSLDNSEKERLIRQTLQSASLVPRMRSKSNNILDPSTGLSPGPSTTARISATSTIEVKGEERVSVSNIREEADHTGRGMSEVLGASEHVVNSSSGSRAIASTSSDSDNNQGEVSSSTIESEIEEHARISENSNGSVNGLAGMSKDEMDYFKNLYDNNSSSADEALIKENAKFKSDLEYQKRIAELERQLADKEKEEQQLEEEKKEVGLPENTYVDNGITLGGGSDNSRGSSSEGPSLNTASGNKSVASSSAGSSGGSDTGANLPIGETIRVIASNGGQSVSTVSAAGSVGGRHSLTGMSVDQINTGDTQTIQTIRVTVEQIYNDDIMSLLENYENGKIKLTLEDGSTVDIDADKVLDAEKLAELEKKKEVLEKEKKIKRDIASKKSELYAELLKFSAYLNHNGHFGDDI